MRPDSYSETSQVNSSCLDVSYEHARACSTQVNSSCLDASYEHARACSTQSPKRILPLSSISFFSRREAKVTDH